MVLPYLKGFSISCVQYFGEWFGLFLLILWVYFEKFVETGCISEFLSENHPIKKKSSETESRK
jgi:hypothetical protein